MSIESHCTTNCNITTNICVTIYYSLCVVDLLLVAQNGLSRNELIEPTEPYLFRENSIIANFVFLYICNVFLYLRHIIVTWFPGTSLVANLDLTAS